MPTGLFDNRTVGDFMRRLFAAPGRTNDFRKLERKLFLVATNLDTGASVTFGAPGHDHVPISMAIEASAALPGLFPPVAIGGEHYVDGALNKTLHASVALDEGVRLLLCVNPLVPFDASRATQGGRLTVAKLNEGGLPVVLSQTFRAIIHSRMKVGMSASLAISAPSAPPCSARAMAFAGCCQRSTPRSISVAPTLSATPIASVTGCTRSPSESSFGARSFALAAGGSSTGGPSGATSVIDSSTWTSAMPSA